MKIEFYGRLAERLGRKIEVSAPDCPIAELRRLLAELRPEAAADLLRPGVRACVDDVLVPDHHVVRAGQSIAFLPPVSGG